MFIPKAALVFSSLLTLLANAQSYDSDSDASSKGLAPGPGRGRTPNPTSTKLMFKRDLTKRCTGSCEECFGTGYTLCPGSEIYCYLPGDATYGLDSCSSDGSSTDSTATASAPASTSTDTGSTGVDDLCYQTGATCQSCFGASYLECPDGYHCYDPTDPQYDTCPEDTSSSGGSDGGSSSGGGTTTTSSCAAQWGEGNIPCGSDGCYNPDIGESCCAGGYYCDAGYTCSSTVGKCSLSGGSLTGDDDSSTSSTATSTYNYGYTSPTSTSDLLNNAPTAAATTTDSLGSSSTGVSQVSDSGSDGNVLRVGVRGFLVVAAAGVGALVL